MFRLFDQTNIVSLTPQAPTQAPLLRPIRVRTTQDPLTREGTSMGTYAQVVIATLAVSRCDLMYKSGSIELIKVAVASGVNGTPGDIVFYVLGKGDYTRSG